MCQNNYRETTSIQSLPEELKTKIFLELPIKDIFSVCLVCKQWNYIVMNNESVWKLRCYNLPEFLHKNFVNDRAQGHNWKVNTGILIYTMKFILVLVVWDNSSNIWCELSTFFSQEIFIMNYGKNGIKRMWQQGMFSNPASYDDLPQGMFSNMDVDSWGDLFQLELDRSWHLLYFKNEFLFLENIPAWKTCRFKINKNQQNSWKIDTAKTGLFIFVHSKCTHCLYFMSLHLTFLFIAYLFTLINFTSGILTLTFCFIYGHVEDLQQVLTFWCSL